MLGHFSSAHESISFTCILLLYVIRKSVLNFVSLIGFLFELGDSLFYLVNRMVCGAVIYDYYLQLIHRILLVDAADDGSIYPLLLVEAGHQDSYPRCVVRIDLDRFIEHTEDISAKEEYRSDDTVQIKHLVELKVNDALCSHHQNTCDGECQQQYRCGKHVPVFVSGGIVVKMLGKRYAQKISSIISGNTSYHLDLLSNTHLIAFRHASRRNPETGLKHFHILKGVVVFLRKCHQHTCIGNIYRFAGDFSLWILLGKSLQLNIKAGDISDPRFLLGDVVLVAVDMALLIASPLSVPSFFGLVRNMAKDSSVLLLNQKDILYILFALFCIFKKAHSCPLLSVKIIIKSCKRVTLSLPFRYHDVQRFRSVSCIR